MKLIILWMLFLQTALFMAMKEGRSSPNHFPISQQKDHLNPVKPQALFAQRDHTEHQRLQTAKPRVNPKPKAPRCSRMKESCVPHTRSHCCDPCASCHCRFFNTICNCWKVAHLCPKKT